MKVLVHCKMGVSRSASSVSYYHFSCNTFFLRRYACCMVFHVRWIFAHHESLNPARVAYDEDGILRQVVRNPSHMENNPKCIFSHTSHFKAL